MTIDKIKTAVSPTIYKYWTDEFLKFDYEVQKKQLIKAHQDIKEGLNNGSIPKEQKYFAEMQLIKMLGGDIFAK